MTMDETNTALEWLREAGYSCELIEEQGRPTILVQDPVMGYTDGNPYGLIGYNTAKVYGSIGESILSCAVRFIEQRAG